MTVRNSLPHYPREGGPEPDANPNTVHQFGLAEVARSRTVLAGVLNLSSVAWVDDLGVSPERSSLGGQAVTAAYAEVGVDAFVFLEVPQSERTEVWSYIPPQQQVGAPIASDGRIGRLELRRLLKARGLSEAVVFFPPMID